MTGREPKVAIYHRSAGQITRPSESIEEQEASVRAVAETSGWVVPTEYVDLDASRHRDRPPRPRRRPRRGAR